MGPVGQVLWWAFAVYALTSAIYIISENREYTSTFAWMLLFIVLPVLGVVVYIFFGREERKFRPTLYVREGRFFRKRKQLVKQEFGGPLTERMHPLIETEEMAIQYVETASEVGSLQRRLIQLLYRTDLALLTLHNDITILQGAEVKYARLMEDIEQAKRSVHMEYFIWNADSFTERLADLLIRKAQEGVKVRILVDALGSAPLLWFKRSYVWRLRRGGVEIYAYLNYLTPLKLHTINYRNHRKIVVIDGEIGYTGGMNMGKEHLDGAGPYNAWRDTHLRITGASVAVLQAIFITSWFNTTNERLTDDSDFAAVQQKPTFLPCHLVVSGPDSQWRAIQLLFFLMITTAEHHVYLQSPYFVPDLGIAEALKTAAMSGVDVRLMCAPRDTASPLPNWAANTYFLDMVRAGVRIFLYQPGYLHAKTMCIDSMVCTVGTANIDLRSLQTNYEMAMVMYNEEITRALEEAFVCDLADCIEFSAKEYLRRNPLLRFRDSLARLLSPLL